MKKYRVIWWDEDDKMEIDLLANGIDDLAVKLHDYLHAELMAGCLWHVPPSAEELKLELEANGDRMYTEL